MPTVYIATTIELLGKKNLSTIINLIENISYVSHIL